LTFQVAMRMPIDYPMSIGLSDRRVVSVSSLQVGQFSSLSLKQNDELTFRSSLGEEDESFARRTKNGRDVHFRAVETAIVVDSPTAGALADRYRRTSRRFSPPAIVPLAARPVVCKRQPEK
jgi:hypothetical protein